MLTTRSRTASFNPRMRPLRASIAAWSHTAGQASNAASQAASASQALFWPWGGAAASPPAQSREAPTQSPLTSTRSMQQMTCCARAGAAKVSTGNSADSVADAASPTATPSAVPVQALLDYLEGGDSLDDFLMDFPSVTREHAIAVLEAAKAALLAKTAAA
mgnify:CR=1 FL=1